MFYIEKPAWWYQQQPDWTWQVAPCQHCYCTTTPSTTVLPPHYVCCKCGDRGVASHTTC